MTFREIKIDNGFCFLCGKTFDNSKAGMKKGFYKTQHHCLPKLLKPKYNVLIPLHRKCHEKLNSLYAHQQKVKVKTPRLSRLKVILNQFDGLIKHQEKFKDKAEKVRLKISDEILVLESKNK